MSEQTKTKLVLAPVPNAAEHTVSAEIWAALTNEINYVARRIDAGEELKPEDVVKVRSLKKQVEEYVTTFNKAMRDAQGTYKALIAKQLDDLGYTKIENYIQEQRKKEKDIQNTRLAAKQNTLREIVELKVAATDILKTTALAGQLLPAFMHRFPKVNSAAKDNEIKNWGPYEAIIQTSLNMLDVFFKDPVFEGASLLPVTSATMQQLLAYIRDGSLEHLSVMRNVFAKDAEYLLVQRLQKEITSKETALNRIEEIMKQEGTADEKIRDISRIIRIAEII